MNANKIFVSSLFALMLIASVFAVSSDAVFSSKDDLSDISEITDDISASDIVESEEEIEADRSSYSKRTISSGSGWVTTSDNGALASIHLVNGYVNSDEVVSKGWMKFGKLKLKLELTESTESKKIFSVSAGDGSVSGTLTLNRGSVYQEGFAVWTGDLDINVEEVSYDAKVNLAIEERSLGERKIKEQRDKSQVSAYGGLELGSLYFELTGKSKVSFERMEFEITGREDTKGSLVIERSSGDEYIGKIRVEITDANGDEDKLSGSIKGVLKTEGSNLHGPVTVVSDDGNSDTGYIKISFNREVDSSSTSSNSDDSREDKTEDRSGSNSGSSDRGFWKRFIDFFG